MIHLDYLLKLVYKRSPLFAARFMVYKQNAHRSSERNKFATNKQTGSALAYVNRIRRGATIMCDNLEAGKTFLQTIRNGALAYTDRVDTASVVRAHELFIEPQFQNTNHATRSSSCANAIASLPCV